MSETYRNRLKDVGRYAADHLLPYACLLLWFYLNPRFSHLLLWGYAIYGVVSTVALLAIATWMASKESRV